MELAATQDPKEGLAILMKSCTHALGNMLQFDPAQMNADMTIDEHGADSLVSVHIRNWFLKQLGVDMQILRLKRCTVFSFVPVLCASRTRK